MRYPALKAAALWCIANGVQVPEDILSVLVDVKALQDYDNALTRIVSIYLNELYTHPGLTGEHFGVDFANAIEAGLNEAWRLGMRENDATEMLPEWQDIVDGIIAEERSHIPDFAAYLTEVAGNAETMGEAMNTAQNRLSLWIQRYTDVYEQAVRMTQDEKTKEEWVTDPAKESCSTCLALNGIVAYAREWDEAGFHPRDFPNPLLECTGARCGCNRVPTDKRRSPDVLQRLLDLATAQGV